ncbi:unnamed protein product [Enterobius vermicularis]|uniref:Rab3 GTPase-activating protein catalytic subunit n=1 Tax=Enterobius vermicularis TaxID=51028 RepID=A0A0N4VD24_ENTVE|nr:unnamed protein product [Enterobius vermicularis]
MISPNRINEGKDKVLGIFSLFTEEELMDIFALEEDCLERCLLYWGCITQDSSCCFKGIDDLVVRVSAVRTRHKNLEIKGLFYVWLEVQTLFESISKSRKTLITAGRDERTFTITSKKNAFLEARELDSDGVSSPSVSTESLDKQQTAVKSKKALYQSVLEAAKRKPRHLISRPFKSSKKFIKRAGKASDSSDECHEKKKRFSFTTASERDHFLEDVADVPKKLEGYTAEGETFCGALNLSYLLEHLGCTFVTEKKDFPQFEVTENNVEMVNGRRSFKADVRFLSTVKTEAYCFCSSECLKIFILPLYDSTSNRGFVLPTARNYEEFGITNLLRNKTFPAKLIASKDRNLLASFVGGVKIGNFHNDWRTKAEECICDYFGILHFRLDLPAKELERNSKEFAETKLAFRSAISYHWKCLVDDQYDPVSHSGRTTSLSNPAPIRKKCSWKSCEDYAFHFVQERISRDFRLMRPFYEEIEEGLVLSGIES